MFSTDFSISGTNEVRGRISVVRAARGRTRIVASFGPKPPAFKRIVVELVAVAFVRLRSFGAAATCLRESSRRNREGQRANASAAKPILHSTSHFSLLGTLHRRLQ